MVIKFDRKKYTYDELEKLLGKAVRDIALAIDDGDPCELCRFNTPCSAEECECFDADVGVATNESGNWNRWTCMDLKYGTCSKMINTTPCQYCEMGSKWQWRGLNYIKEDR